MLTVKLIFISKGKVFIRVFYRIGLILFWMEILSKNIRIARENCRFTQDYMANKLGITQAAYSNLERGKSDITVVQLITIARTLHVEPADLISSRSFDYSQKLEERVARLEMLLQTIVSNNGILPANKNES